MKLSINNTLQRKEFLSATSMLFLELLLIIDRLPTVKKRNVENEQGVFLELYRRFFPYPRQTRIRFFSCFNFSPVNLPDFLEKKSIFNWLSSFTVDKPTDHREDGSLLYTVARDVGKLRARVARRQRSRVVWVPGSNPTLISLLIVSRHSL